MTDEQKRRKLAELEELIRFAENATPDQRNRVLTSAGLDPDETIKLAATLRRQLSGEPAPASTAYHVSRRMTKS